MNRKIPNGIALGLLVSALSTFAEEAADPSVYDTLWNCVEWTGRDDAKVLQSLTFSGRLQGDAYSFNAEDGAYEGADWRRLRLGFKAKLFSHFTLHSEMDLDLNNTDSWNTFYKRLTDSYMGWSPSKDWKIKVGKQSAGFTLDGATSSKKLIVPERSIVAGNLWFPTEYFTGASAAGKRENWSFKVGGFSSSGEAEFGHFDSGYFGLLSAGRKIGKTGSLRLDYVYNDPDYNSDYGVGTKKLKHIASLVYKQMFSEKLGLWADLVGGTGISKKNQSDLLGVDLMPFYNFTDRLQLVIQYAGVTATDSRSVVKMSRYANKNAGKKVETAHNLLLGFNWYLYGHKLKWQNAIEYNYGKNLAGSGEDYNGYGVTSAFRLSW